MSVSKIEAILAYIRNKDNPPVSYETEREGKKYRILISRLELEGTLEGFIRTVFPVSTGETL